MAPPARPLVSFLIGGAQKAGTSALAQYLQRHPRIRLPREKEAHVFDAPETDGSVAAVNARYATCFGEATDGDGVLYGDATPFYLFHRPCVERIAVYNPKMRWIVLLRDPADRALSHYRMERARGRERLPLWLALLLEPLRMRGERDPLAPGSRLRRHSYRARGDYARQLDALYAHFPREQVLLLRSKDLRTEPARCMAQVHRFLGFALFAPEEGTYSPVFVGGYPPPSPVTRLLLRWWTAPQRRALRERHGIHFD